MTAHVALDVNVHKHLKLDPTRVEEAGADLHMIPVVVSEFMKLVVQYPIVLTKHAETGAFSCICLTGIEEGENLFWHNAQFDALYVPHNISRQPFVVGNDDTGKNDYVLCFDTDSKILNSEKGKAIFNADGSASQVLTNAQESLTALLYGEKQTSMFIELLLDMDLIVPLTLEITLASGANKTIQGLYSIDEDKLNALNNSQLNKLHTSGFLQSAFTQVASLGQIYRLIELKNQRDAAPDVLMQ
jgi:hypothetical protein